MESHPWSRIHGGPMARRGGSAGRSSTTAAIRVAGRLHVGSSTNSTCRIDATIHPREASNLALACFDCNRYKGSDLASLDPETGSLTPLFNPRLDDWSTHFETER